MSRSQTCPQCRNDCNHYQTKRIYIDFACDEDLACAQVSREAHQPMVNADAEETIKILLEHIENGPVKQKPDQECEFCKEFQEAYNDAMTEKDLMAQQLKIVERENGVLMENKQQALKVIAKLELEVRANGHNLQEMKEKMETLEGFTSAVQSNNLSMQDIINNLKETISHGEIELQEIVTQLQHSNDKMKQMRNEHREEMHLVYTGLQNIIHGNAQRRLIKHYRKQSVENVKMSMQKNTMINKCQDIVPFCGDIDSWDFFVIPILKNSSHRSETHNVNKATEK